MTDRPGERCRHCDEPMESYSTACRARGRNRVCQPKPPSTPVDVEREARRLCLSRKQNVDGETVLLWEDEKDHDYWRDRGDSECVCALLVAFATAHTEEAVRVERERWERALMDKTQHRECMVCDGLTPNVAEFPMHDKCCPVRALRKPTESPDA